MSTTEEKIKLINSIEEKRKQQKVLLEELKLSLLIQEIWPEAFDYENGRLHSTLVGEYGGVEQFKLMKVRFWNEKAEKEFLLIELPLLLRQIYLKPFLDGAYHWYPMPNLLKFVQNLCKEDVCMK